MYASNSIKYQLFRLQCYLKGIRRLTVHVQRVCKNKLDTFKQAFKNPKMSKIFKQFSLWSVCLVTTFSVTVAAAELPGKPDTKRIKAHMSFLADDLLEGRETGSRGHEIASLYIASAFAEYGLKPAGNEADSAYMQRVSFRYATLDQESPQFTLRGSNGAEQLSYPKQFIMGPDVLSEASSVSGELVFVGYGITAPLLSHDDYAGLDVDGKIVVVLSGKPE